MEFSGKKVTVVGTGISGIGAVGLLNAVGAEVVLYDGNEKLKIEDIEKKLGKGLIDISISGFAAAHIQSTSLRGIWRSRIFNNAGKALFDAYVVTKLPPEVAENLEEMRLGARHCEEILRWLKDDLKRGSI